MVLALVAMLATPAAAWADAGTTRVEVCTQPLGSYDRALLAVAERGIRYLYGVEVRRLKPRPLPSSAYYPPRKRYRADRLLDHLEATVVKSAGCDIVIGFTRRDISTTKGAIVDWGILGLGQLGGRVAMVSSYRMRGTSARNRARRAVKVINHELGHVLGVDHYQGKRTGCLMNDANGTVLSVDKETGLLCPESIAEIERERGLVLPRHRRFDWKRVL